MKAMIIKVALRGILWNLWGCHVHILFVFKAPSPYALSCIQVRITRHQTRHRILFQILWSIRISYQLGLLRRTCQRRLMRQRVCENLPKQRLRFATQVIYDRCANEQYSAHHFHFQLILSNENMLVEFFHFIKLVGKGQPLHDWERT